MQQAIAAAEQMEPMIGNDIRGHRLSQNIRDFYEAQRAGSRTIPVGSSAAESFDNLHRQQYQALQDYWHQYPGLAHNRDLWNIFLARNGMPPNTPHQKDVTEAENALRTVLDSGIPSPDWSLRARHGRALAGSSGSGMLNEAVMHFYETIDFMGVRAYRNSNIPPDFMPAAIILRLTGHYLAGNYLVHLMSDRLLQGRRQMPTLLYIS